MERLVHSPALQHTSDVWCEKCVNENVNNRIQCPLLSVLDEWLSKTPILTLPPIISRYKASLVVKYKEE